MPLHAGRDIATAANTQLKQLGELHIVDGPRTHNQVKHKNKTNNKIKETQQKKELQ